jgi:hypothetical protein
LNHHLEMSSRRKRSLKKALSAGLDVSDDSCHIAQLWDVLESNLSARHGAVPVHSAAEITLLHSLFPHQIRFITAHLKNELIAGIILFLNDTTSHAQYIASNRIGHETGALDLVFDYAIRSAKALGHRYFNFGISCEDNGKTLNDGLYRFKTEFGGAGIIHEFYEIRL